MKNYLATFELISGDYGQMFMRVFAARNQKQVEKNIQHYLKTYYHDGEAESEQDTWSYFGWGVAIFYIFRRRLPLPALNNRDWFRLSFCDMCHCSLVSIFVGLHSFLIGERKAPLFIKVTILEW